MPVDAFANVQLLQLPCLNYLTGRRVEHLNNLLFSFITEIKYLKYLRVLEERLLLLHSFAGGIAFAGTPVCMKLCKRFLTGPQVAERTQLLKSVNGRTAAWLTELEPARGMCWDCKQE